jgi:uncharacterized protein (TIGR00369 family)
MSEDKLNPEQYAEMIQRWAAGSALGSIGTRFVSAGQGQAHAELEFRPEHAPLTGRFHIGVIMTLAEETASSAGMWEFNATATLRPDLIPLTFQVDFHQVGNTDRGKLIAKARIVHRGRTILVVNTEVRDDQDKLLATMTTTQLAPRSAARGSTSQNAAPLGAEPD